MRRFLLAGVLLAACSVPQPQSPQQSPQPSVAPPVAPRVAHDNLWHGMSYSPYDNLETKAYPATLVTTSFNDSQVMYWEPAKYVAKLRTLKTDDNPLLLKCKLEAAGHGGASGRYDRWRDRAFEMAWMLDRVGVRE